MWETILKVTTPHIFDGAQVPASHFAKARDCKATWAAASAGVVRFSSGVTAVGGTPAQVRGVYYHSYRRKAVAEPLSYSCFPLVWQALAVQPLDGAAANGMAPPGTPPPLVSAARGAVGPDGKPSADPASPQSQSFLRRYWYIILPAMILLSSGGAPPEEGAKGGGGSVGPAPAR